MSNSARDRILTEETDPEFTIIAELKHRCNITTAGELLDTDPEYIMDNSTLGEPSIKKIANWLSTCFDRKSIESSNWAGRID